MFLQNGLGEREADAVARERGRVGSAVERLENVRQVGGGNADAEVDDLDAALSRLDDNRLAISVFPCVFHDVADGDLQ